MAKLVIEIREDLFALIQNEAFRSGKPIDAIVEQALREYLDCRPDEEQTESAGQELPRKPREFGSGKGTFIIPPDFDEPLGDPENDQ